MLKTVTDSKAADELRLFTPTGNRFRRPLEYSLLQEKFLTQQEVWNSWCADGLRKIEHAKVRVGESTLRYPLIIMILQLKYD